MQQHCQLSCRRHNRSFLSVPPTTLGQLQSPTPEITLDAERSQNVLRSLHQQRPYSLLQLDTPRFIHHTVPTVAISQIQSDGQLLLRNIPALLHCYDANLLHCRSPFSLCLEHVDNLGAYTASRPETGLLPRKHSVQAVRVWSVTESPRLSRRFTRYRFKPSAWSRSK